MLSRDQEVIKEFQRMFEENLVKLIKTPTIQDKEIDQKKRLIKSTISYINRVINVFQLTI